MDWLGSRKERCSKSLLDWAGDRRNPGFFLFTFCLPQCTSEPLDMQRQLTKGWKATFFFTVKCGLWVGVGKMEKETATHSSILAWRIPGMMEPGGLPSTGSHRVRHELSDLAAAAAAAAGNVKKSTEKQRRKEVWGVSKNAKEHFGNLKYRYKEANEKFPEIG